MGTTLLAAIVILAIGILAMSFNIVFRHKEFPKYDVGSNEELKKRGIRCYKDEDAAIQNNRHCPGNSGAACKDCNFYGTGSDSRAS